MALPRSCATDNKKGEIVRLRCVAAKGPDRVHNGLENLLGVLREAKMGLENVVKTTVYLADIWPSEDQIQALIRAANGRPLTVIGTDGGLLSAPIVRPNVLLGPAERVEVWADFSGMGKGDEATLVSRELDLGPLSGMTGPGGMRGPAAGGRS